MEISSSHQCVDFCLLEKIMGLRSYDIFWSWLSLPITCQRPLNQGSLNADAALVSSWSLFPSSLPIFFSVIDVEGIVHMVSVASMSPSALSWERYCLTENDEVTVQLLWHQGNLCEDTWIWSERYRVANNSCRRLGRGFHQIQVVARVPDSAVFGSSCQSMMRFLASVPGAGFR